MSKVKLNMQFGSIELGYDFCYAKFSRPNNYFLFCSLLFVIIVYYC